MKDKSSRILDAVLITGFLFLFIPLKPVQFFAAIVLLTVFFSYIYIKILTKYLTAECTIQKLCVPCKEDLEITYSVENHSVFPVFSLYTFFDVSDLLISKGENSALVNLRAKEKQYLRFSLRPQQRGLYNLGPLKLRFSDPFNIFTKDIDIQSEIRLMVRPRRINLFTKDRPGIIQGRLPISNPVYEDITQRRSIREYQSNDELKRINWRASARFSKLYTNEYENTFDSPYFIFLDLSSKDYPLNRMYESGERAIEIAAELVLQADKNKQSCGFACFGTDFPYIKPSHNQTNAILDVLSTIKMVDQEINYDPVQKFKTNLMNGTRFFYIGPEQVSILLSSYENGKFDYDSDKLKLGTEK